MAIYSKILIPLDGSDLAEAALPHALDLAEPGTTSLILLRVVPNLGDFSMVFDDNAAPVRISREGMAEQRMLDRAQEELEVSATGLRAHGLDVQVVTAVGNPAREILALAQSAEVDVIVMSTHGRSGVDRWIHGSVAAKLMEAAPCPLLVIPALKD